MDDKKYLDDPSNCFGWCKIEPIDWQSASKNAMCSCKCASWGKANMANTPPYNTAFDNIQQINKPKKSKRHKKRKLDKINKK